MEARGGQRGTSVHSCCLQLNTAKYGSEQEFSVEILPVPPKSILALLGMEWGGLPTTASGRVYVSAFGLHWHGGRLVQLPSGFAAGGWSSSHAHSCLST